MKQPLAHWSEINWKSQQKQFPTPQWLNDWREQQLKEFLQRGFPKPREENWRYTSITPLLQQSFISESPQLEETALNLSAYHIPQSFRLVFINGVFSRIHSEINDLADNLILTRTHIAMNNLSEYYQPMHDLNSPQHLTVFYWLNGALLEDGLFLWAMPGAQITKPIHLLYINAGGQYGQMHHPRHILRLQEGSRAAVIEEYIDLDQQAHFNNAVTQISLAPHSVLTYCKLQRQNKFSFHTANTCVLQQQDSVLRAFHIASGSKLNRDDFHVALQEPGADCDLAGFYHPQSQQLIDFHTRIDHCQPHTRSSQFYKGMIEESACGVFNGKIIVHPSAQKIKAQQQNHNLLLANSAEVNTKPELEVYADNVQCSHGATVGRMDPNALFYLRSRGLTLEEAQQMLKIGFCRDIFDRIPHKEIAEYIKTAQGIDIHV